MSSQQSNKVLPWTQKDVCCIPPDHLCMSCCGFGRTFWTSISVLPRLFRCKLEHVSVRPHVCLVWTAYRTHGLTKIRRIRTKTALHVLPSRHLLKADAFTRSRHGKNSPRHSFPDFRAFNVLVACHGLQRLRDESGCVWVWPPHRPGRGLPYKKDGVADGNFEKNPKRYQDLVT